MGAPLLPPAGGAPTTPFSHAHLARDLPLPIASGSTTLEFVAAPWESCGT